MVVETGADWATCGLCGARLKGANLERHYAQVHPGEKPETLRREAAGSLRVQLSFAGVYALVAGSLIFFFALLTQWSRGGSLNLQVELFLPFLLFVSVVAVGMTLGADK
ncbi:MAG: hypothetical protein QXO51_00140 [Halobacteria archaeon]